MLQEQLELEAALCQGGTRYDVPHPVRRLRLRPWLNQGQEMRPLQYTLLWARMPETTLARVRP